MQILDSLFNAFSNELCIVALYPGVQFASALIAFGSFAELRIFFLNHLRYNLLDTIFILC